MCSLLFNWVFLNIVFPLLMFPAISFNAENRWPLTGCVLNMLLSFSRYYLVMQEIFRIFLGSYRTSFDFISKAVEESWYLKPWVCSFLVIFHQNYWHSTWFWGSLPTSIYLSRIFLLVRIFSIDLYLWIIYLLKCKG